MCSSSYGVFKLLALALLLFRVGFCLNFRYPTFPREATPDFIFNGDSYIVKGAIQVTPDLRRDSISNISARVWYSQPFRLSNQKTGKTASFNSTFVLNLTPQTVPGGEGIAFILTAANDLPANSFGQWLGITNATINGSSLNNIVAVEFDTKKSYPEDIDDNHVGLDINSVYSILQVPLTAHGVNLSSGTDLTAKVQYDGDLKRVTVSVFMASNPTNSSLIISGSLDLTNHLPETVFVGFSASTGNSTQLNCVRAWDFTGVDIGGDSVSENFLWLWILISVILIVLLGGGLMGWCYYFHRKRKRELKYLEEDPTLELEIQNSARTPRKFRLKELRSATGDFSPKNELGRGGFGTVYKGFLNNNRVVAVKRVSKRSEHGKADFVAEVKTIGNLHHKNLVKLAGWCHESNELLLVYEFMPNGSLEKYIFPQKGSSHPEEDPPDANLDWERRRGIIGGVATALDYLHNGCEKRVLHRDIKASNILLDSDFNARLGDFGLARTIQLSDQTHHSTKEIAGTPGYMAPESFHTGRASAETDVYAFGVLVLEVVCGRKPGFQHELNNFSNGIVDWVWERYQKESIIDVVDFRLNENEDGDFQQEEVERVLVLGLACCHPNPYRRPSIRTAVQVLTGEAAPPSIPVEKPAFMWPASVPPSFDFAPGDSFTDGQLTPSTITNYDPDTSFTEGQLTPSKILSAR